MLFFVFPLVFHLFFSLSFAVRADYSDINGKVTSSNTLLGSTCYSITTTAYAAFCADNTYVYGFGVLDYPDYGILNVYIDCRKQSFDSVTSQWTTIDAQKFKFAELVIGATFQSWTLRESEMVYCTGNSGKDFVRGSYLRMWCPSDLASSQGIVEMKMQCSFNNQVIQPATPVTTNPTAPWTGYTYCKPGYVACGFSMLRYYTQSNDRKYGAVDFNLKCCRVCETIEGFFFNSATLLCEYCDKTCQECSGSASFCTKCHSGYMLSATNTCDPTETFTVVSEEFFDTFTTSDWSINTGTISQTTCGPYSLIGGYNVFDKNVYIEKTFSFSAFSPHFMIRIFVQVFKIGNWLSDGLQIIIDGSVEKALNFVDVESPLYYNNDCGGGNYIQNSKKVEHITLHSGNSLTIRFSPIYSGAGFWGINRLQVHLFLCDASCLSCSGASANLCTSCAVGKYLTASATCDISCASPYYGDPSTNECKILCPTNYFINNADRQCYAVCPSGKFGNSITGFCETCDPSCETCSGPNPTECMSCQLTFLQTTIGPSQCLNTCPAHTYKDTVNFICQNCDPSCQECTNAGLSSCTQCPSGKFLTSSPGPSTCGSCSSGFYRDTNDDTCKPCEASCLECSNYGANYCSSCALGTFLQYAAPSYCLNTCPDGKFADNSDNTCKSCDTSCSKCLEAGSSGCTVCATNLYLQDSSGPSSCLSTCPSGYYKKDTPQKTCAACHSSCLSCSGPLISNCLTCYPGKYLASTAPSYCIGPCPNGLFYNTLSDSCEICDVACETCSKAGIYGCESCNNGTLLQRETGPTNCESMCSAGYYPDTSRKFCISCDSTCLNCTSYSPNACTACSNNKFLLSPPGPSSCNSVCKLGYYGDNTSNFCTKCDDSCNECLFSGSFGCINCKSGYYFIANGTNLTGKSVGVCHEKEKVTPLLQSSQNALQYKLVFSKDYSKIYELYKKNTTIAIEGVDSSLFNFTITEGSEADTFIISLCNISFSITNYPLMQVNLNPNEGLLLNYSIELTTYKLTINMSYFYYIDQSTKELINSTQELTSQANNILGSTFLAANFLSYSSGFVNMAFVSMDIIRYLRHFEVAYPENVVTIFQTNPPTVDMMPKIQITEESLDGYLPENFQFYGISIYLLNNNGNMIIQILLFWIIGVLLVFLIARLQKIRNPFLKVIMITISLAFVWNYSLSYFFSKYIPLSFFMFLALKFPTTYSNKGYFNLVYTIIMAILTMLMYPFFIKKISNIRKNLTKIRPEDENIEEKKYIKQDSKKNSLKSQQNNPFSSTQENYDPFESPLKKRLPSTFKKQNSKDFSSTKTNVDSLKMSPKKEEKITNLPIEWHLIHALGVKTSKEFDDGSELTTAKTLPENKPRESKEKKTFMKNDSSRYGLLHQEFKNNTIFHSYFVIWNLLRQLLYTLTILVFSEMPFEGLIIVIILNSLYIITFIIVKPYKQRKEFYYNLFNEICAFLAMIFAFCIAYLEKNAIVDEERKINFGWVIVFANLAIIAVFLIRLIIELSIILGLILKGIFQGLKRKIFRNKVHDANSALKNEDCLKQVFDKIIETGNFLT